MGSKIEWTDITWNPVTGCSPVSIGCNNCYAKAMHQRLRGMGIKQYQHDFKEVYCHGFLLNPKFRQKPMKIFVGSMADIFHKDVPESFIKAILDTCQRWPQHTFQFLTKRAERLPEFKFPPNAWVGVTVENASSLNRIEFLKKTVARIKFISFEPFLFGFGLGENKEPQSFQKHIEGIDWVIAGGETGIGYRWSFDEADKIKALRNACIELGIPFFFKQWHKKGDRKIMGDEWNEFPVKK
jgi:protein gp37